MKHHKPTPPPDDQGKAVRTGLGILPSSELLSASLRKKRAGSITKWFPETGPYSRDKYPKIMEHFKAGALYDERALIAANRSGKTVAGSFETTLHATGLYPDWWEGKKFYAPTHGYICNETAQTCRNINQLELMGKWGEFGTGVIPADLIIDWTKKPGVPEAVEFVYVRHVDGGRSLLEFKSYDQGRTKFQGSAIHYIWIDEECPEDVYGECQMRTMTTGGVIYCTYTPIKGLTRVTIDYFRQAVNKDSLPLKLGVGDGTDLDYEVVA